MTSADALVVYVYASKQVKLEKYLQIGIYSFTSNVLLYSFYSVVLDLIN